jgi:hypothetical protein
MGHSPDETVVTLTKFRESDDQNAGHPAALVGTINTGFGAALAVLVVMFGALRSTGIAAFRTQAADFAGLGRVATHETCRSPAEARAVKV